MFDTCFEYDDHLSNMRKCFASWDGMAKQIKWPAEVKRSAPSQKPQARRSLGP